MTAPSGLSFIEIKHESDPAILLEEWIEEAKHHQAQWSLMNLATATKQGKVSNRTVVIREIIPNACPTFMAQTDSNKIINIRENPQVAATVLLIYNKNDKKISRQVRLEGVAEELSKEQCKNYYEKERLSSKIRGWICQNSGATDWHELKSKHDHLLKEVEGGKILEMPDTQVAYKIIPNEIDFYYSYDGEIADRVLFKKTNSQWKFERLKA